jgi:hypothetical protein
MMLVDATIAELQRAFLDDAQIASSKAIMGIDTQLIDDGTYFVIGSGRDVAGCGGWSRRATLYGRNQTPARDSSLLDPAVEWTQGGSGQPSRFTAQGENRRKRLSTLGNGGSASTAGHMPADIAKNTIGPNMRRFRVLSLNNNTAMLTALANDLGYASSASSFRTSFDQARAGGDRAGGRERTPTRSSHRAVRDTHTGMPEMPHDVGT